MTKSTPSKKERTAAALAGTLSAFTDADAEEPEPAAEAEQSSPPETEPSAPTPESKTKSKRPAKATSPAETHPEPPFPAGTEPVPPESSRFENLKEGLQRITGRTRQADLDLPADAWPALIESWLANVTAQEQTGPDRRTLIQSFTAGLKSWSEPARQTFFDEWRRYCTGLGFELDWLVDDRLKNSPLKLRLQRLALAYIADYQRAQAIRTEIELFKRYLAWRQESAHPRHRALNHTLFVRLSYQEVIPPPPPEIYLAPDDEREAYIRRMLWRAAEQDPATFLATLAETET